MMISILNVYIKLEGLSKIGILGKKAWFSGNTSLIKIISHDILILIEGSKVQHIKK